MSSYPLSLRLPTTGGRGRGWLAGEKGRCQRERDPPIADVAVAACMHRRMRVTVILAYCPRCTPLLLLACVGEVVSWGGRMARCDAAAAYLQQQEQQQQQHGGAAFAAGVTFGEIDGLAWGLGEADYLGYQLVGSRGSSVGESVVDLVPRATGDWDLLCPNIWSSYATYYVRPLRVYM